MIDFGVSDLTLTQLIQSMKSWIIILIGEDWDGIGFQCMVPTCPSMRESVWHSTTHGTNEGETACFLHIRLERKKF